MGKRREETDFGRRERQIYDPVRKEKLRPNSFGFRAFVNHRLMSEGGAERQKEEEEEERSDELQEDK